MVKRQTGRLVESLYVSNGPGGEGEATFMPSATEGSSPSFPVSSILISSVSSPLVLSLPDSHRQTERRQSTLTDKRTKPQKKNCTKKLNNNLNNIIRTNVIIDNNRCGNDRVRQLLLKGLETAQSSNETDTNNFSALGSNSTRFGYSDDMSLYHRNPKLQPTRKSLQPRIPERKKKSNFQKGRKRLAKLLHTHAALIVLSVLVVLDATCVIGQLLADIFIVKENLERTELEKLDLARTLQSMFPKFFNNTDHLSLDSMLGLLKDTLEAEYLFDNSTRYIDKQVDRGATVTSRSTTVTVPDSTEVGSKPVNQSAKKLPPNSTSAEPKPENPASNRTAAGVLSTEQDDFLLAWKRLTQSLKDDENILKLIKGSKTSYTGSVEERSKNSTRVKSKEDSHSKKSLNRRSESKETGDLEEEHDVLLEVTHVFHLASLSILSILLFETLLKIFAMGRKLWNHKLEVFDAGVIITSWSLDLAFKDGIWDHPGSNAATILIILLPWRVVRIVNSFVLVIQEKDNVRLKLIKQRYRSSERRTREYKEKLNKYRVETKSLQGVCRKFGVPEGQITACMPIEKRKRSSLALTALSEFASLAMVSTVGSLPNLASKSEFSSDSSSSDDEESSDHHREIDRTVSADSAFSQTDSIFSTVSFTVECADNLGEDNIAYTHETLGNTGSLPTYEDAMISVYNSNTDEIQSQNQHTKL